MNAATLRAVVALPCPGDLWHDAAVIAQDDACTMVEALDGAAAGYGFHDLNDAAAAICADWRASILRAQPTTDKGRDAVRDALRMVMQAGGELVASGWSAGDLFGLHRGGSRHGLAFLLRGGQVEGVTPDTIEYRAGAVGRLSRFTRASVAPGALPFWQL